MLIINMFTYLNAAQDTAYENANACHPQKTCPSKIIGTPFTSSWGNEVYHKIKTVLSIEQPRFYKRTESK